MSEDGRDSSLPRDEQMDRLRRSAERQRSVARRTARDARRLHEDYQRTLGELARAEKEVAALRRNLRTAEARLGKTDRSLRALRARRSVRLALALSRTARRLLSAMRWGSSVPERVERRPAGVPLAPVRAPREPAKAGAPPEPSEEDERRLRATLFAQLGATRPVTQPLVSIVMLNRDGEHLLRQCLPALAVTDYPNLELIVVDNASSDASVAVVESFDLPFPARVVRNAENLSYSDASAQGVGVCRGNLLLFLNNDAEPVSPGWLSRMVETISGDWVHAVGARLIYPRRPGEPRAGAAHRDLTLQHGGIAFAMRAGVPIAVPLGAGDDPASAWAAGVREEPALTAACLLVRRDAYEAVDGFSGGYDYGQEDVDLCLKLRSRGGRLIYDGRAALWHHESATRILAGDPAARRARYAANQDRFVSRWAVPLYRTVMLDALDGRAFWRREPLHVALITPLDPAPDVDEVATSLRDALAARAFRVTSLRAGDAMTTIDAATDVAVILDGATDPTTLPPEIVSIAWSTGKGAGTPVQAIAADIAVDAADGDPGDAFTRELGSWLRSRRVGIRIPVGDWKLADRCNDTYFAQDLQRALRRRGWHTRLHLRPTWDDWVTARDDVTIDLLGLYSARPRPGRCNVLWHISHPDLASPELYEHYDFVFVASDSFAAWMADKVAVPVRPLHQATDPSRFRPDPAPQSHQLLFVAGWRASGRHILEDLLPTRHGLAVYGRGWTEERLDPRYVGGSAIPNDELAGHYAAAAIVLNDHWEDMQREGFLSNRLYDASAAGAFVVTDDVEGVDEEFDGGVAAYVDPAHLSELVDHYLVNPDQRRSRAETARRAVLARHTFDHRASELIDAFEACVRDRPLLIEWRAPSPGGPSEGSDFAPGC